ncbi:Clan CD, family C13, asparaginyl endopeptidase-like cysteine peptidase [Tritrichomonas foetus]|uniref:Clan CD, family C13, asparaginyl endopeptidase-like cysteine peptidase n=1 Tax=Tritrichomonas foetus TaxID=1144522 RepID=A0A1J4JUH7_9EUKA|nr:Clan CD, family C13, asparaginyl endopeptidase-like cysteine peptidase [Tritrichomonas foetus]|eukprot:OHT01174.1 Clan CD, family C13, asparaginyl endopeptidase-like cysteine peptidase [Tritrichomonas foetus]
MTGNTTNGPALKSNENDNVFVFFDDHGGDGILGVPELCGAYIYADELLEVFQYMYDNKMYKKLFSPITACYAGSVAKYLNDIPNLYIQTASGEDESSYATMYDSKIGDYLTSEYSLYKDEFIEQNPTGTLGELYEYAKEHTEMSHVQEYGDLSLKDMTINEFVGNRDPKPSSRRIRSLYETTSEVGAKASLLKKHSKSYTSLERAEKNVRLSAERACEARLNEIIDGLRQKFVPANSHVDFTKSCERINFPAYRKVLNAVQSRVQVVGETFYEKTFFFSNLCNLVDADLIVSEIEKL